MSGSSSATRSTQTTNNTSLSQGIQGDNSGVVLNGDGNTIQMTDMGAIDGALNIASEMAGGALDVANYAVDANASLVGQSLDYANDMAQNNAGLAKDSMLYNAELAQDSMSNSAELASGVTDASIEMLGMSLDANGQALNTSALLMDSALGRAAGLISNQQEVNNSALMAGYELATQSVDDGNALALALTEQTTNAMIEQSSDTFDSLNGGFKSMMQFADNASRSDGAMVAKSSNKVLMVGLGVAGLAAIAIAFKGKI